MIRDVPETPREPGYAFKRREATEHHAHVLAGADELRAAERASPRSARPENQGRTGREARSKHDVAQVDGGGIGAREHHQPELEFAPPVWTAKGDVDACVVLDRAADGPAPRSDGDALDANDQPRAGCAGRLEPVQRERLRPRPFDRPAAAGTSESQRRG